MVKIEWDPVVVGRRPTPTSLKLLKGNPGKRPLNKKEPKPPPGAPGCPTWLSLEAKAEWRRVVPIMDKLGLLSKVDRAALATYCESWATFVYAQRLVHKHGIVIRVVDEVTADGMTIITKTAKNPAIQVARDAADKVRQFGTEFGLTPSARTRLEIPEADDGDVDSLFS
jgi:P27 family predicted phage terminase small subunit